MPNINLSVFEFDTTNIRTGYLSGDPIVCLKDLLRATKTSTTTAQAQKLIEDNLGEGVVIVIPLQTNGGIQVDTPRSKETGILDSSQDS